MMPVSDTWNRIEAWLAANASMIRKSFRPAAKASALKKLQTKIGLTLPTDFIESLARFEGQKEDAEHGLFPIADKFLGAMPACQLFSIVEIDREWSMLKGLLDDGEFAGSQSRPQSGVRDDWWNPGWVPIAGNGGGDSFCLDMAPDEGGSVGQVIYFFHDMKNRPLIAPSFSAWLEELAGGLESGRYVFDEDNGIIETPNGEDA